jgi:hypothetical protein
MTVIFGVLTAFGLAGCVEPKVPVGIGFQAVAVPQMLLVYAQLTGKTVLFSKDVRQDDTPIQLRQIRPMTRHEACKLIEQDLREQAGIIILRQDHKDVVFGFEPTERFEPTQR